MTNRKDWTLEQFKEWFYAQAILDDEGCMLWKGRDSRVQCKVRWQGKQYQPHQLSFIISNGPVPAGMQVNHRCDKHNCIRPSCLYAGTPQENVEDMMRRGRWVGNLYQQGKGPHNSIGTKRTPEQRARIAEGVRRANERRRSGTES